MDGGDKGRDGGDKEGMAVIYEGTAVIHLPASVPLTNDHLI
jgi:hypothetical protein